MMRIVSTVEARMRSTRLPGKVLKPILGKPMLELMIERLRLVPEIEAILVATTTDPSCDPIERLASRLSVGCYRGSEEDVLGRVLEAARSVGADLIVETTGDCPLIDPVTVSRVINTCLENDVDYCSNTLDRTYPRGMDVQVFPLRVLETVSQLTNNPVDREHVSCHIYEHPEQFRLLNVSSGSPEIADQFRLTVDTPEDFELVRRIFEALYPLNPRFALQDILALLKDQPDLAALNNTVRQKAIR